MSKSKPEKVHNSGFSDWKASQLPELAGKCYVITGGNSGLGLEAARFLGNAGADVIIACRNPQKAGAAVDDLSKTAKGKVSAIALDLTSTTSIRQAADALKKQINKIDGLVNNAGIMQTPYSKTEDGFELQLGTNHFGHFLWTALLFDLVEAANGRIVTVSSVAHKFGKINFDDLQSEKRYSASLAYCQSKLANLSFAMELHRRLQARNSSVQSIACHPGYSATNLQSTGPTGLFNVAYKILNAVVAQDVTQGALPTALAAAGKEAKAGGYYGPQALIEARGRVGDAVVYPRALDEGIGKRLWEESEKLLGMKFL